MSDETRSTRPAGTTGDPARPAGAGRRFLGPIAGLLVGLAIATFLFVDPFGFHPLDERIAGSSTTAEAAAEEVWICPMHPEIVEDGPGSCPICGMDLVPSALDAPAAEASRAAHGHGAGEELWTCPMHPEIVESEPGDCPICGMDLVEMDPMDGGASSEAATGRTVVELDPSVVQRMNVATEVARREVIARPVRATGSLAYDPEGVVTVTTKFSGFIERVYANYQGQEVRRGQPLFEIYSPELVQTQEELLSALEYARRLEASGADEEAARRARGLVEAAGRRLAYWDITRSQIERLEREGTVERTLTVVAPASGVVTERLAGLEGMAVQPGMQILQIADLSELLAEVDVYESQLAQVGVGTPARIEPRALPGAEYRGVVRFVEPALESTTRTARLLVDVANRDRRLRPGMYATVVLAPEAGLSPAVTVSNQAVLRTGRRELVVVDLGGGRFAPREVETGRVEDGRIEILSGLDEGERVVTSAQFLIDSESNLRAAIQQMRSERTGTAAAAESMDETTTGAGDGGHVH